MPSSDQAMVAPPSSPAMLAMKVRSGSMMISASTRGRTRVSIGSSDRVRMASISSRSFIEPMAAV